MKVLIHENKEKKNIDNLYQELIESLKDNGIEYKMIKDSEFDKTCSADAIFSFGGDGTLLFLTEFSARNSIPVIGINAGRLGFLTEFEKNEIKQAVLLLKENKLIIEKRTAIKLEVNGKLYVCQNDAFLHRVFSGEISDKMIRLEVRVDGAMASVFKGDGIIIATPTGSTAYSLSAGGPILVPSVNVFMITPIAAHSLVQRPIVFPDNSKCEIHVLNKGTNELYADGRFVEEVSLNDKVVISKFEKPILYYRKPDADFFMKLNEKLKNNAMEY